VFLEKGGVEITMDAIIHGQVIYESLRVARFEFEQRMMMFYADFKPLLNKFDREILQRI
jgi:hypothetical protein